MLPGPSSPRPSMLKLPQQAQHQERQRPFVAIVLERLRDGPQVQHRGPRLRVEVRRQLPHAIHERLFESDGALEAALRRAFDALVEVGGERRVVVGDAELLEVVERVADAVAAQARQGHQFVGGDALVDGRVDQSFDDPDKRLTVAFVDPGKVFPGLVERADQERGSEYLEAAPSSRARANRAGLWPTCWLGCPWPAETR